MSRVYRVNEEVNVLGGSSLKCVRGTQLQIQIQGKKQMISCLVMEIMSGIDAILGMDAISKFGGVTIKTSDNITFGEVCCESKLERNISIASCALSEKDTKEVSISDSDFKADFDGNRWTVSWFWKDKPPTIGKRCANYSVNKELTEAFESEIQAWIDDEWLIEYSEELHGYVTGNIPFMAIDQPNKNKVRPVMDYKELNTYIVNNPGNDGVVCDEKLREWRKMGANISLVDLRKAYLQIFIDKSLYKYQRVVFKNKCYVMTRMGFGLAIAPKVMTAIVNKILSANPKIREATDSYIDDIIVNNDLVSTEEVIQHLEDFGLKSKEPNSLGDNTRVLGLKTYKGSNEEVLWTRDSEIPKYAEKITRRQLYSLCGKTTGHYPVCGKLRILCSYLKRRSKNLKWDEYLDSEMMTLVREFYQILDKTEEVGGVWCVDTSGDNCCVWADASSIATACCIEVNGQVIEDACWLKGENNVEHINMGELEAAIKGVTLAIKWGIYRFKLCVDSATVFGWVKSLIHNDRKMKVAGLSEMVIRRRLWIVSQLISEYKLEIDIKLVPSEHNKADRLTRVPREWVKNEKIVKTGICFSANVECEREIIVQQIHNLAHFGVSRTEYLVQKLGLPDVTRKEVDQVVKSCQRCNSVDPSPIKFDKGNLHCDQKWFRLALDITYFDGKSYLSIIDCCTRYVIWRLLTKETSAYIVANLKNIFNERGYVSEILTDNASVFLSSEFKEFCNISNIRHIKACAYRHQGNGMVERVHRTIKRMAARTNGNIFDMIFYYNNTPNKLGQIPAADMFAYQPRFSEEQCNLVRSVQNVISPYSVGDKVFVKPGEVKCTTEWNEGTVTDVLSPMAVEIDGINRHISHIRPRAECKNGRSECMEKNRNDESQVVAMQETREVKDNCTRSGRLVKPVERYLK